jgi:glycosyltransferase involved in cell wall biosynthesis
MLLGKRIAVVLPAYNAARTLEKTVADVPVEIVDDMILVDDYSKDETVAVARQLGLKVLPA